MLLFPFSICSMFQMFPNMFLSLVSNTWDHLAICREVLKNRLLCFLKFQQKISLLYLKFQHRLVWYLKLSSLVCAQRSKCFVITCWGGPREKNLSQASNQTNSYWTSWENKLTKNTQFHKLYRSVSIPKKRQNQKVSPQYQVVEDTCKTLSRYP